MNDELSVSQLVGIAATIRQHLDRQRLARVAQLERQIELFLGPAECLKAIRRKLRRSREMDFAGATKRLVRQTERPLRELPFAMNELGRAMQAVEKKLPSLKDLFLELKQCQEEFGGLRYEPRHQSLSLNTDPVVLDGVYLGEFEICLEIRALSASRSAPYRVIALDPHPASSNSAVTHPHVSEEQLCAGDAGAAIQSALDSGRIFDLFTLVQSVLSTYNPESPYVSLDNWLGTPCYECGYMAHAEDLRWCSLCERDFCDECTSSCSRCDETTCLGCLHACPVCDDSVCRSCLNQCPDCGSYLCKNCLDDQMCPCHEEQNHDSDQDQSRDGEEERRAPAGSTGAGTAVGVGARPA